MAVRLTREQQIMKRELEERVRETSAGRLLGFELERVEPGRVVMRLRVQPRHLQVYEVVHGGVIAALADTAGGLATYMSGPRGARVATIEMKINFLEAVDRGTVRAEAWLIRRGRNFSVVECDVRDATRMVAKALMTFSIGSVEAAGRELGKQKR